MYTNTGYLHQTDIDLEDLSRPLIVESCGIYRFRTLPVMKTSRPLGRKDYQLLYIASGKIQFFLENQERELAAGHVVLYRPGIPQKYTYLAKSHPEVYWIHFTGRDVEMILGRYGFPLFEMILYTGISSEYQRLFLQIIRELQVQRPCFGELLPLLLEQIFLTIRRDRIEGPDADRKIQKEVERAVHFFNENFYTPIRIEEYAAAQHMSTCWFIRNFKQYTGMPPMQYITSIRIAKAKSLLESTDYNIGEIASIVGYDNPLYFSRIFKKLTGNSPARYRKKLATPPPAGQ